MKAQKHECFHVNFPFSAYHSLPLHHNGKGSIILIKHGDNADAVMANNFHIQQRVSLSARTSQGVLLSA